MENSNDINNTTIEPEIKQKTSQSQKDGAKLRPFPAQFTVMETLAV